MLIFMIIMIIQKQTIWTFEHWNEQFVKILYPNKF